MDSSGFNYSPQWNQAPLLSTWREGFHGELEVSPKYSAQILYVNTLHDDMENMLIKYF